MVRVSPPAGSLSMVDFGAPAAERDIERGLEEYFVESEAYNRIKSGAKRILIGGRGIGKSAIFQMLARRERDAGSFVIELTPEDYSYELLTQTMASQSGGSWAKYGAYAAAWKYLIYVLIMKEVAARRVALPKGTGGEIYRYIRDNHVNHEASRLAALVSYLKRMEGIKVGIGPYEASMRTRELEKLYKLEEIHHLLPALRQVAASRRMIVLVDELDRGWDSSEDARAFVAGLFQACMSVNSVHPNLRVYMSLRQELYEEIPELYDDAQKYRDLIENVRWSSGSLLTLVANRIRHSIPALARQDDQACWGVLFGAAGESFPYMIDRTLYRPREIIQFCVHALEHARDSQAPVPLATAALREAEDAYSSERARDIAAEYRFQYPGLLSVLEAFRGRGSVLTRDDLDLACLELITGEVPTRGALPWLEECTPESLTEILWSTGFLRAEIPKSAASGSARAAGFLGPHQGPHHMVHAARRFQIHPMFWAYLSTPAADRPGVPRRRPAVQPAGGVPPSFGEGGQQVPRGPAAAARETAGPGGRGNVRATRRRGAAPPG